MKITEYPEVSRLEKNNVFLLDGPNGTKTVKAENLPFLLMGLSGAEMHRNIFRGKKLGSSLASGHKSAIKDGTFDDLWLGDYWEINSRKWRIVDFDYWYDCGDEQFTDHHIVVMPDDSLYTAKMNSSNNTTGGYVGSDMYTSDLGNAKTMIKSAFGSNLLTHREYLINAVSNGRPSGGSWYDSTVELPNEIMIYGSYIFTPSGDGSNLVHRYTIDKTQLALFKFHPKFITTREPYWLRDVVDANRFTNVSGNGFASYNSASADNGVRPVFAIG